MQTISVETLKQHIPTLNPQKEILIDVRTPEEYRAGHIPGAVNRPLDDLERHVEELSAYETVYAHCRSGGRSAQACERLGNIGLEHVVNVEGGAQAWEAAGYQLEK